MNLLTLSARVVGAPLAALVLTTALPVAGRAAESPREHVKRLVDRAIVPLMERYDVPGIAVGIVAGAGSYEFDYGVASRETGAPVTPATLFELGSVSKTLTATLAAYAQASGRLRFSDTVATHLPALRGTKFGDVRLLDLATHTPGGMPLQVPEGIANDEQLMRYLRGWEPAYAPGTYRTYANPSIGMLGVIAAKSMGEEFTALMERRLFPALGMNHTFIDVPKARWTSYAQGYTAKGAPIRMADAVLSAEAYGVKSTAGDMVRFLEANMGRLDLDAKLRRAIAQTHTGYFEAGRMTQDLVWEQYAYPVDLETLLAGNSGAVSLAALPVREIAPPQGPRSDVLINKTGSTNGFAAYIAFVPGMQVGVVILANRNCPIEARVTAAYRMIVELGRRPG
ncbi:MAG TPA: class C beta-lactamase [Usitatibacter sp.]|nr:class C beta-lactamase [Usitatibacter sp.]